MISNRVTSGKKGGIESKPDIKKIAIEQVAQRLSYSEPICFINAFKRWTGTTPLAYRRQGKTVQRAV